MCTKTVGPKCVPDIELGNRLPLNIFLELPMLFDFRCGAPNLILTWINFLRERLRGLGLLTSRNMSSTRPIQSLGESIPHTYWSQRFVASHVFVRYVKQLRDSLT